MGFVMEQNAKIIHFLQKVFLGLEINAQIMGKLILETPNLHK